MKNQTYINWVKSSIPAHSALGLVAGIILYLICLSGTLLVFTEAWERWEQPNIPEFQDYNQTTIKNAVEGYVEKVEEPYKTIYVVLPTEQLPRIHVANKKQGWWVNQEGTLLDPTISDWTELVSHIHTTLLLPEAIGIIIVSIFSALLLGLIVSGIVSHPTILKDAFMFRMGGNRHSEQQDIHNRLSVWGLPFHVMIAITGAFFGLTRILVLIAAPALYDGNQEALINDVYGADPTIEAEIQPFQYERAFDYIKKHHHQATPIYLAIQNYGTENQFLEVATSFENTLSYSEMFRFHANGEYIDRQGLIGGPAGRQILYSTYRLHFGWYSSNTLRWLYVILGLSLTIICVSGINMWLAKRKKKDWINDQWVACVWGYPIALCISALVTIVFGKYTTISFFAFWGIMSLYCALNKKQEYIKRDHLVLTLAASLLLLAFIYSYKYLSLLHTPLLGFMVGLFALTAISLITWNFIEIRDRTISFKQKI